MSTKRATIRTFSDVDVRQDIDVISFFGGLADGPCIQLAQGTGAVTLTRPAATALANELRAWVEEHRTERLLTLVERIDAGEWDDPTEVYIKSFTTPEITYRMNLVRRTCTCPSFMHASGHHESGLCKHLRTVMAPGIDYFAG